MPATTVFATVTTPVDESMVKPLGGVVSEYSMRPVPYCAVIAGNAWVIPNVDCRFDCALNAIA